MIERTHWTPTENAYAVENIPLLEGNDLSPAVELRAYWSGEAAGLASPYDTALAAITRHLDTPLRSLQDWGCNSTRSVNESLGRLGLHDTCTNVQGIDILSESAAKYFLPEDVERASHVKFFHADPPGAEMQGLTQDTDGIVALNVLFRAEDAEKMVKRISNYLRIGGIAAFSSNNEDHARLRHSSARDALIDCSERIGIEVAPIDPPAKKLFFSDLIDLLEKVSDLEVVETIARRSDTVIDKDHEELFMYTVMQEVIRSNLPKHLYSEYYTSVRRIVEPIFTRYKERGLVPTDKVDSGIAVVRKVGNAAVGA